MGWDLPVDLVLGAALPHRLLAVAVVVPVQLVVAVLLHRRAKVEMVYIKFLYLELQLRWPACLDLPTLVWPCQTGQTFTLPVVVAVVEIQGVPVATLVLVWAARAEAELATNAMLLGLAWLARPTQAEAEAEVAVAVVVPVFTASDLPAVPA